MARVHHASGVHPAAVEGAETSIANSALQLEISGLCPEPDVTRKSAGVEPPSRANIKVHLLVPASRSASFFTRYSSFSRATNVRTVRQRRRTSTTRRGDKESRH